jgi:ATP-binding cassette subfamily F protein 3
LEPLRRQAREAESAIERLTRELAALDRRLASPSLAGDGAELAEALKRRAQLSQRIAEAEAQWLAAEEGIERGSAPADASG